MYAQGSKTDAHRWCFFSSVTAALRHTPEKLPLSYPLRNRRHDSGGFQSSFRLVACMTAAVLFRTPSLHMILCI